MHSPEYRARMEQLRQRIAQLDAESAEYDRLAELCEARARIDLGSPDSLAALDAAHTLREAQGYAGYQSLHEQGHARQMAWAAASYRASRIMLGCGHFSARVDALRDAAQRAENDGDPERARRCLDAASVMRWCAGRARSRANQWWNLADSFLGGGRTLDEVCGWDGRAPYATRRDFGWDFIPMPERLDLDLVSDPTPAAS